MHEINCRVQQSTSKATSQLHLFVALFLHGFEIKSMESSQTSFTSVVKYLNSIDVV